MLISLHRLRIPECISFKLAVLTYRAIHGVGSSYLQSRFTRIADMPSRRDDCARPALIACMHPSSVDLQGAPIKKESLRTNSLSQFHVKLNKLCEHSDGVHRKKISWQLFAMYCVRNADNATALRISYDDKLCAYCALHHRANCYSSTTL